MTPPVGEEGQVTKIPGRLWTRTQGQAHSQPFIPTALHLQNHPTWIKNTWRENSRRLKKKKKKTPRLELAGQQATVYIAFTLYL